jgi:hypothetical protein
MNLLWVLIVSNYFRECYIDFSILILPICLLCSAATEASQEGGSKENPENNPDFTTVYVGNLGHEVETNWCCVNLVIQFLLVILDFPSH